MQKKSYSDRSRANNQNGFAEVRRMDQFLKTQWRDIAGNVKFWLITGFAWWFDGVGGDSHALLEMVAASGACDHLRDTFGLCSCSSLLCA